MTSSKTPERRWHCVRAMAVSSEAVARPPKGGPGQIPDLPVQRKSRSRDRRHQGSCPGGRGAP
jgi:hypothetical protein